MPAQEVFLPKKRTLEETLAFAAEQLPLLEATVFSVEALEPALKQLGTDEGVDREGELHAAARDPDRQDREPAAAGIDGRLRQGANAGPGAALS